MHTFDPHSPWKILFPKGNLAVAAPGKNINQLADGEIGIFSNNDCLTIDAASIPTNPSVFLATGGPTVEDSSRSLALYRKSMHNYNVNCYRAGQCKIIELSDICASCEETYIFKISYCSQDTLATLGAANASCLFSVQTSCCDGCEGCPSGNCVELVKKAWININKSNMFIASVYAKADAGNLAATPLTEAQIDALFILAEESTFTDCPVLRITACPEKAKRCCNIPGVYPEFLNFDLTFLNDECCGKVTVLKNACHESQSGAEVCNDETEELLYQTSGSSLRDGDGFMKCMDKRCNRDAKYTLLTLSSTTPSAGQLETWNNNYNVVIAIECADTTTLTGLTAFFDVYTEPCMLPPQSAIAAACDCAGAKAKQETQAKEEVVAKTEVVKDVQSEVTKLQSETSHIDSK